MFCGSSTNSNNARQFHILSKRSGIHNYYSKFARDSCQLDELSKSRYDYNIVSRKEKRRTHANSLNVENLQHESSIFALKNATTLCSWNSIWDREKIKGPRPRPRPVPTCPPAHLPTCPPAHLPTCPAAHQSITKVLPKYY